MGVRRGLNRGIAGRRRRRGGWRGAQVGIDGMNLAAPSAESWAGGEGPISPAVGGVIHRAVDRVAQASILNLECQPVETGAEDGVGDVHGVPASRSADGGRLDLESRWRKSRAVVDRDPHVCSAEGNVHGQAVCRRGSRQLNRRGPDGVVVRPWRRVDASRHRHPQGARS